MLSPIQLEEHKILGIHFDTHKIDGEPAPLRFRHSITVMQQDEEKDTWLVRLDVQFLSESEEVQAPYIGEITVGGVFKLSKEFPEDKASDMVHMNGGAILFGTVRELLNSITSRSIHGSVMLPTVDARCFLPTPADSIED